ncbi:PTS lactose/cellobiose transporter subunit IIA [Streptococcus catagoni]|uniref:PTS lactose/cellobiose transporter subunit IIA n=1 Tax=Streptococcus catagoni TaxID=2654874 RepID=UPI001407C8BD|nr:PTS lactose/cellobiose transporter subunit IIA [Streptococcus catagoni]
MQDFELLIFTIISRGGNAKGLAYEAISEAEKGNFEKAEQLLKEADSELKEAHQIQTNLIQEEASGKHHDVTVLFVHAQDHLMTSIEVRNLAEVFIRNSKRLYELERKIQ